MTDQDMKKHTEEQHTKKRKTMENDDTAETTTHRELKSLTKEELHFWLQFTIQVTPDVLKLFEGVDGACVDACLSNLSAKSLLEEPTLSLFQQEMLKGILKTAQRQGIPADDVIHYENLNVTHKCKAKDPEGEPTHHDHVKCTQMVGYTLHTFIPAVAHGEKSQWTWHEVTKHTDQ